MLRRTLVRAGGFSLVYRAMYKGTPVAVKQWFNPDLTEAVLQEFRQEVRLRERSSRAQPTSRPVATYMTVAKQPLPP